MKNILKIFQIIIIAMIIGLSMTACATYGDNGGSNGGSLILPTGYVWQGPVSPHATHRCFIFEENNAFQHWARQDGVWNNVNHRLGNPTWSTSGDNITFYIDSDDDVWNLPKNEPIRYSVTGDTLILYTSITYWTPEGNRTSETAVFAKVAMPW